MSASLSALMGILFSGIIGLFTTRHYYMKSEKQNAKIGHLSSQSKSICSGLDSFEKDLQTGKIGANSAQSVLKPIKQNMESLNGELEAMYEQYIGKRKKHLSQ